MILDDVDPKTKKQQADADQRPPPTTLVYDDAKRLATYTSAQPGAHGRAAGRRDRPSSIELFLQAGGNELERAEGRRRTSRSSKENARTRHRRST